MGRSSCTNELQERANPGKKVNVEVPKKLTDRSSSHKCHKQKRDNKVSCQAAVKERKWGAYQNAQRKMGNGKHRIKWTEVPLLKPGGVGILFPFAGKWFVLLCQVYWEGESKEAKAPLPHQHCLVKYVNSQAQGRAATLILCNFPSSNAATSSL